MKGFLIYLILLGIAVSWGAMALADWHDKLAMGML